MILGTKIRFGSQTQRKHWTLRMLIKFFGPVLGSSWGTLWEPWDALLELRGDSWSSQDGKSEKVKSLKPSEDTHQNREVGGLDQINKWSEVV